MPVAPLVGAWIEIQNVLDEQVVNDVAPLVGAWIEIHRGSLSLIESLGRSSCRSVD